MESEDSVDSVSSKINLSKFGGWGLVPGGVLASSPGANVRGQFGNNIDLYGKGTDSHLYHNIGTTTNDGVTWTWGGWNDDLGAPGNGVIGRGSSTTWNSVRSSGTAVAVRATVGSQNQAFVKFASSGGSSFGSWVQIGNANLEQDPALVFGFPFLYLFGVGTDHQVWYSKNDLTSSYNPSAWTGWSQIPGGNLTSELGAAALSNGQLYVAARGTDNHYYLNKSTNSGANWSGWSGVNTGSNTFVSGPAITVAASGSNALVNVFGTASPSGGVQALLNVTSLDGGASWGTVGSLGGNLTSGPAAYAFSATRLEVFARDTNNQIEQDTYHE